ncbi:hypothetical protein [Phytohabitans aurantiacus]|uniref:ABC transporter permease n=1 Tax=Phytohabitans aurantiacus TaxID=3016789 RepID=A0ABQ5R3U2_9ACTN|nr:hypothetical protein [Phytohabitans aurantiacus]GLI00832.1 hypothetical protein Pa4123_61080 [Phytohabitans aurantiacus]
MSEALEARYRRLLRAYPKGYRHERGAEMMGTLMEAAGDDQRRPTAREAAALVLRGLQARAGAHHARSVRQSWLGALRLAVLLLLVYATAGGLAETGRVIPRVLTDGLAYPPELFYPLGMVITALAVVAVARGRYVLGLLATLGGLAATLTSAYFAMAGRDNVTGQLHYPEIRLVVHFTGIEPTFWPLPLALLLIAPLIAWPAAGTRRPLPWLLGVLAAVFLLPTAYEVTIGVQPWATVAVVVGFLLWTVVDARATIAAGVLLVPVILALLVVNTQSYGQFETLASAWFWTLVVGAVALVAAGTFGLRRQARL